MIVFQSLVHKYHKFTEELAWLILIYVDIYIGQDSAYWKCHNKPLGLHVY